MIQSSLSNGYLMNDLESAVPERKHPGTWRRLHPWTANDPLWDSLHEGSRPWLANDDVHQLLRDVWSEATAWLVGRYIIMPDHIHLFAGLATDRIEYRSWIKYWKSQFTKRHKVAAHRWQVDSWDTRMRSSGQYEEKWDYVRRNAVRHGLVQQPEDWPYQGVLHELRWD